MKTLWLLTLISLPVLAHTNKFCVVDQWGRQCFTETNDRSSQLRVGWGARGYNSYNANGEVPIEACFSGSATDVAAMVQAAFIAGDVYGAQANTISVEGYDAGTLWVKWTEDKCVRWDEIWGEPQCVATVDYPRTRSIGTCE